MSFEGGFTTQGVPYITGSDGQILTWSDAEQRWVAGDGLSSVITAVSTSNGIVGDGSSGNTVRLDNSISVQNLTVTNTASIAHIDSLEMQSLIVGDKYITILSGANTHATADGAGFLWGSGSTDGTTGDQGSIAYALYRNSYDKLEIFPGLRVSGSVTASAGFSGSFTGDGSGLINVTTKADHVIYVAASGSDSNDGSIGKPFATISGALAYANTKYPNYSESVMIEVGPGTYSQNLTLNRYNTYVRSTAHRQEQRAVAVTGKTLINSAAGDKYNRIIGFQGIFFNHNSLTNPTVNVSGSTHLTYFKDCYFASNGANAFRVENVTTSSAKIVLASSTFLGQKGGTDIISINGGDVKIDTIEVYFTSVTGSGNGINQTGNSLVSADRVLVDLGTTITGSSFVNSSTNYTGNPTLYLSNASLGSSQVTTNGALYSTNVSYLWNVTLTNNSKIKGNNTAPNPFSAIVYSDLTSVNALTFETITRSYLKDYMGDVNVNSLSASAGLTGSLLGTASYATNAGNATNLGGVPSSSYARKDQNNIFTGENEFRDDVSITQEKNLVLVLDPFALKSGDIIVQGGTISNIGGDIRTEYGSIETVGGEFVGAGTGLTDLSSSNWRDGGSGPEQQFIDDVRSLLSGGNNITYDSSTGVIETTINPNLYVSKAEATASLAFIHETNTFTEPQIIEVDAGGNFLTVKHASIPGNQFIVDYSGNVGVRANPYYDRTNHDLDPFALTVNNTIVQRNVTKGIVQQGSYGPMLLRDGGSYRGTFDQGGDNAYETFGKYGIWSFPNELTFTIPDTNVRSSGDVPQQNWFKFKLASRSGPSSSELFTISNFGIAVLNADLTVNGDLTFDGNLNLTGDLQANSFTGSFSGSAEGIYGLTGSMWTGASSFADDVRVQLEGGTGINYDSNTGIITWTGVNGGGGLLSKNNITGSGKFGEEFDLVDDITVTSVTAYLSGTAERAEDSDQLGGIDAADYAHLHATNVIFSGDNLDAQTITATVEFSGPGTGITDLTASNWRDGGAGGEQQFIDDVRSQITAISPIAYDPTTGEITYTGAGGTFYADPINFVGDGTYAAQLELAATITADLDGNASTATLAANATNAANADKLGTYVASDYPRIGINNTFSGNRNTFTRDISVRDVTGSHFVGDGFNITNITASNIRDWNTDVSGVFQAGANIVFTANGNRVVINSTGGGGGGGGLTTGSITGSGVLFDEIRLKPGIFVDYIDYNTASAPSPNELGRIQYDSTSETLQYNFGNGHSVNLGQQNVIKVQNDSGATINKNALVSAAGNTVAGVPSIELSDASNAALSEQCIGFVLEDILDGDSGYVLTNGLLYDIDTSLYSAGDKLFLDSAGAFIGVKPTAPSSNVVVGIVVESGVVGAIYVKISYPTGLQTLNDTEIDVTKADGDLLVWDDANSYWKNSHGLVGDYTIDGNLSASVGITASMFYADTSKTSVMRVTYADTASYTIDPGAARTGINNDFVGINKFTNHVYFGTPNSLVFREVTSSANTTFKLYGPLTASSINASNLTVSNLTFTGAEAVFDNNITVNGTASIAFLETRNQQSLQVGDKYITILSGSSTHVDMDEAGILFGSGSTDITTGVQNSVAHIVYRKGNAPLDYTSDYIEIFPGLKVSGSLTSTNGLTVTGSIECTTDISASSISASYIYGDGTGLSNINAVSSTNNIITVTTSSTYGTISAGSVVSFSGSLFCAADNTDERRSNFIGVVTNKVGNDYTVATTGIVSASAATSFIGGDIVYVDGAGSVTNFAGIPAGGQITQVGIASYDIGTSGNIIIQPRIFGVKSS